ncbi:MAG: hypothetical protein HY007_02480 [Candidatus Sungbacteria bacterium]|nr:hypothetical protein [Candidatus Sungbacteria bacterium]
MVFEDPGDVERYFQSGVSPNAAVALFDERGARYFNMMARSRPEDARRMPAWTYGSQWAVCVHERCHNDHREFVCARQLYADFFRRFEGQLHKGSFPWGSPRKKEFGPTHVVLPQGIHTIIRDLNSGPDLMAALADAEFAAELPSGSRISWYRVVPEPVICDRGELELVTTAMRRFEQVCDKFVRATDTKGATNVIHPVILKGVHIEDEALKQLYLFPPTDCFSIARPDLHYKGADARQKLFASENDEMPGGFPEVVHMDAVYGINQAQWQSCFDWLTSKGLLLFVVSHDWSKCYIPEMRWLVEHLRSRGYNAQMITTDSLDEVSVTSSGVSFRHESVGTIWRQFPIFETRGMLAELVKSAASGAVRMVPEFAHFGNKVWFSIFRSHAGFFRRELSPMDYAILDDVLPDSSVIDSSHSFPCTVDGIAFDRLNDLLNAPEKVRDSLVLKICGANALSARSYGVLMGHGLDLADWQEWIRAHLHDKQPIIIQRRLETGVARIPVQNLNRNAAELFSCRILFRPWVVNGKVISVSGCAVPSNTLRVHGRVDMAMLPVQLE